MTSHNILDSLHPDEQRLGDELESDAFRFGEQTIPYPSSTRNEVKNGCESPSPILSNVQVKTLKFQLSDLPGRAETKKSNKPAHDIYGSKPKKKVQITQDQGLDVSFRKEFQAIRSQNVQRSKKPI